MLDLLRQMIRIRRFEDKCAELYTQEKIRGFMHLYDGEEAVAVGVISALEKRDRIDGAAHLDRAGRGRPRALKMGAAPAAP
jgi:TPP-dependent pyruvate/acetoin dehydrogenase alpha subunit